MTQSRTRLTTIYRTWTPIIGFALLASACGTDSAIGDATDAQDEPFVEPPLDRSDLGGDRPAPVTLPQSYTAAQQWPLVILLHGYSATGSMQEMYFGMTGTVDTHEYILIIPEGKTNSEGKQFWNATPFCCDWERSNVDDVGYLSSLIEEAKERYNINEKQVYLFGHSNGGFMSYRMACERPELITGIMSLAGSTFINGNSCNPSEAVTVLQVHGTNDQTISYYGQNPYYPSAEDTVQRWSTRNGCTSPKTTQDTIDIDTGLAGSETTVTSWTDCADGAEVELWTINNGSHLPGLWGGPFTGMALDFLFAHEH